MNARDRFTDFWTAYTRDLKAEDLQRLFTRDAKEAYRFFTRHVDAESFDGLPWPRRIFARARAFVIAVAMRLSPARRLAFGAALVFAAGGLFGLLRVVRLAHADVGRVTVVMPGLALPDGTGSLLIAFGLMTLLVVLELADRLSLKNDLEIAREIQQAMLPAGRVSAPGIDAIGLSRPANTVGGDFYDILPLGDGRVVIAVGDVAGKGSPAALLMALLLAILRTLVDERLEPAELMARLNVQVSRHAPSNRFITLFYAVYNAATGELRYVNAGHMPPLVIRGDGAVERLADGGVALGMFDKSTYEARCVLLRPEDLLAVYSDGITEAESPRGEPFDEPGLERTLCAHRLESVTDIGRAVVGAVELHTADTRLADDLTILLLRRSGLPAVAGV